jgi:hypothetical protein
MFFFAMKTDARASRVTSKCSPSWGSSAANWPSFRAAVTAQ